MNLEDIVYNNHRAFLSDTFHVSNEQWIFHLKIMITNPLANSWACSVNINKHSRDSWAVDFVSSLLHSGSKLHIQKIQANPISHEITFIEVKQQFTEQKIQFSLYIYLLAKSDESLFFFWDRSNEKRLCWRETLVASVLHMLSLSKCPAQAQQTMKYTEGLKSTQKAWNDCTIACAQMPYSDLKNPRGWVEANELRTNTILAENCSTKNFRSRKDKMSKNCIHSSTSFW